MTAPSDILLNILATFLTPLFLGGPTGNNDPAIARAMAIEVLQSFRFQDACELLLSVQIVSFSLAAVGSIALSMAEDTSNTMLLRLRGNANNCNRSAETNRRALDRLRNDNERLAQRQAEQESDAAFHARYTDEQIHAEIAETQRLAREADARQRQERGKRELAAAIEEMRDRERRRLAEEIATTGTLAPRPPVKPLDPSIETISLEDYLADPNPPPLIDFAAGPRKPAETQPVTAEKPHPAVEKPATPLPPTPDQEQARRNAWANAMNQVAAEFASETFATPAESRANKIRIQALSSVARTLLNGTEPEVAPPFQWKETPKTAPLSRRKP